MDTEPLLAVRQLQFIRRHKTVLDIPAWTLSGGHLAGVLGPNGAGKSTFLKLITGEWHGTGSISFHGRFLKHWKPRELARHLAVLPQASRLSLSFSAREVAELGTIPLSATRQQRESWTREAMERTHTDSLADALFTELSGGEQQRVQLARVLVQLTQAEHKPLLVLDEPISAQDLMQQHAIMQLVRELAHEQGWGVLAVLHDINFASHYCDRLCLLHQGKQVIDGTPQQCLHPEIIEKVWGYRPQLVTQSTGQALFF